MLNTSLIDSVLNLQPRTSSKVNAWGMDSFLNAKDLTTKSNLSTLLSCAPSAPRIWTRSWLPCARLSFTLTRRLATRGVLPSRLSSFGLCLPALRSSGLPFRALPRPCALGALLVRLGHGLCAGPCEPLACPARGLVGSDPVCHRHCPLRG